MSNLFFRKKTCLSLIMVLFIFCFCAYASDEGFMEKRSTYFIVYYQKGVDQDFIKDIIETAEEYYNEIASNLGYYRYKFWRWDERAKIYIFPDQISFQKATNQPDWSGGCASYYEKKIWTYPHAAGFFDSILPHELGHIIFREFVGFDTYVPLWFEEGIASYQERSKRYAAKNVVKNLLSENKLLSIEQLSVIKSAQDIMNKAIAEMFYSESVSIIYFLISKYGSYKFAELCKKLKENRNFEKSLKQTYYNIKNLEDLQKEWVRYLSQ